MIYPSKGLRKQYWRWSNCFYLCFIPRRDCKSNTVGGPIGFYWCIPWRDCESRTVVGPIVFTCVYPPGSKSKALRLGVHLILLYLMGRTGWTDGRWWKVSFKFFYTLWVYRLCICILIYGIKIVRNILMGFKISCQVGGRGKKIQNYSR